MANEIILPRELPLAETVYADSFTVIDDGAAVVKATPQQIVDAATLEAVRVIMPDGTTTVQEAIANTSPVQAQEAAERARLDADRAEAVLDNVEIDAQSVTADRVAAEAAATAAVNAIPAKYTVATRALLDAVQGAVANDIGFVTAPEASGGGYYSYSGTAWAYIGQGALANKANVTDLVKEASDRQAVISTSALVPLGGNDAFGRMAWGVVRAEDGQWPDWTVNELSTRILPYLGLDTLKSDVSTQKTLLSPSATLPVAVYDMSGKLAWGTLDPATGQWPDWAIAELSERIGSGGASSAGRSFHLHNDGNYYPTEVDMTKIVLDGSSTPARMETEFNEMLATIRTPRGEEVTQINMAQQGERAEHMLARMGAQPAKITFPNNTIPATGITTGLTSSNIQEGNARLQSYRGTFKGTSVYGSLQSGLQFVRLDTGGTDVVVPPDVEFIPELGPTMRGYVHIQKLGKNNMTDLLQTAEEIQVLRKMAVDYLMPLGIKALIPSEYLNTNTAGMPYRDIVLEVNRLSREAFGAMAVDEYAYILSPQLWVDIKKLDPTFAGPTQADLDAQANGEKAPSISADDGHYNALGNRAVCFFVYKPALLMLGYSDFARGY